jgi:hypothetical protein
MGYSGLFELDLTGGGDIYSLAFDRDSLEAIAGNDLAQIHVDIVYEGGATS